MIQFKLKFVTATVTVCAMVLISSCFITAASEGNFRIVYLPFGIETLVPVTVDSIWKEGCEVSLDPLKLRELSDIINEFKYGNNNSFNNNRVRLGVNLSGDIYYFDANINVYIPKTRESKTASTKLKRKLNNFLLELDCKY